ncbi:MAG TPA: FAD-dependent oxidoreductase [Thermoanaerobaculia bacterium]|nr:FAD-dependent oxidoreductase [Thermoanaerobaculia bacterium]
MIEMTLYGRGGQGGVTLAKLIASAWFARGKHAQAFGVYAAERSGAPIQAYVRVDDDEITNHNQIRTPDHVIVLDPTLIGESILAGASPDGWIILNTSQPPDAWPAFRGRRVATVDATAIANHHGLGTRTVPIVNTTMMGALARIFGFTMDELRAVFAGYGYRGDNLGAAQEAFDSVVRAQLEGEPVRVERRADVPSATKADGTSALHPTIRTGSWATRRPERRTLTSPCNAVCPAGNDVQRFLDAAARGDYDRALAVLLETSPLPGICARVCPAPCMDVCNRSAFDEGVNVREVERFVADHARWPDPVLPWRRERVAVVGSGPAGISAAYHLARNGVHVALFDASDELGGVLRNGIPDYRLPKDVLDRELGFVLMHGVNAYVDSFMNAAALDELASRYDAVFVATGLQSSRAIEIDAALQGIDFLDRVHRHDIVLEGEHVVVAGGGNTAVDAARSALRLGAVSVRIVYRRTRADMPAIEEEIAAALDEGVLLDELALPERLDGDQLHCIRMLLGDPDETGRRRPIPDPSLRFTVDCDHLILALGQEPDRSIAGQAKVLFGGDFATNEGTVAAAIASGRKAAETILRRADVPSAHEGGRDVRPPQIATMDDLHLNLFEHAPQNRGRVLPPELRQHNFLEVHTGLDDAALEARRCLSCGVCNTCDRCRDHCPDGILTRAGDEYRFDYDYCKGCGVCASECPRGVVVMTEI